MKFSYPILNSVLLASTVFAAPHPNARLSQRLDRRARPVRDPTMRSRESSNKSKTKTQSTTGTTSNITYSENWSGLAYTSPPKDKTFNAVSAKFTVPTPSIPSDVDSTDGEYSASAWVGIDGDTYTTAILQTGVDFTVTTSGETSFDAWYEWYPDSAYDFDITISAGDEILMYVNATTSKSGSATIENLTTGKTATKSLTSTSALGGKNAEWIVEDYESGDSLVALADFGNVTFTDCVAYTSSSSEGVSDATIMDIENTEDEVLTNVTLISDHSFEVSYTSSSSASTTSSASGSTSSGLGSGFGNGGGSGGGFGEGNGGGLGGETGGFGFGFKRAISLWGRGPSTGGV